MSILSRFTCVALLACAAGCGGGKAEPVDVDHSSDGARHAPLWSSSRGGMGATVHEGGVTFRIWAPNATHVWVKGDFNGWDPWQDELGNEFNGNFSGDLGFARAGHRYRYVIEDRWGNKHERNDPRAQRVENSTGPAIIHDPGSYWWQNWSFRAAPREEQVLYELHIGTFNDSPGWGPGNFRSAIDRLDHIASLGVNMISVMPVNEFAGDFSWGYNPAFPFAPESAYGSPDDMKAFIDAAHNKGMGVIVDVVNNHWGSSDLPMWCIDGDCLGKGGVYFYTDGRIDTPWGPRPDYGRKEVREFIKDQAMMFLHEYRADGLRWDAVNYIRANGGGDDGYSMMQWINNEVDASQPWKLMIAEDFGGDFVSNATQWGGMGFDAQWSGDFVHPVRRALVEQNDGSRNLRDVANAISQQFNGSANQRVIYTENHDETANGRARLPEEIWPGNAGSWAAKKRSTLGAALLMTSPGVPMIFQGQEFLEDGHFSDGDPLHWEKAQWFGGIIEMYRRLIQLRRNFDNNTRGLRGGNVNVHHVNDQEKMLAYHRWNQGGPGDDVVVVANFTSQPRYDYLVGFPECGLWRSRFNSDWNGYSPDFGNTPSFDTDAWGDGRDGMPCTGRVNVGPYSAVIFSK